MTDRRLQSPWEQFLKKSQSLRKGLAELLHSARQMASDNDGDILGAEAALRQESVEWEALFNRALPEMLRCARELKPSRERHIDEFADRLKRLLIERDTTVYGESSLLVVNGLVHIDLDIRNAKASVNGLAQRDLSVKGLADQTIMEFHRIRQAVLPPERFGAQMLQAYTAVLPSIGVQFSAQVSTLDLLPHVLLQRQVTKFLADPQARQFKEYPLCDFRADLYGLFGEGKLRIDGATFHWSSGSNTKGAVFMFVPSLERTSYVGRVWFEREGGLA